MYVFSAPGKVIIHGEHSVVYGKTAIAGAIDLRTFAIMKCEEDDRVKLTSQKIYLMQQWTVTDLKNFLDKLQPDNSLTPQDAAAMSHVEGFLSSLQTLISSPDQTTSPYTATLSFLYIYCSLALLTKKVLSLNLTVETQLVVGSGLGSSASYCVCIATALLQLYNLIPPLTKRGSEVGTWSPQHNDLINRWAHEGERIIHGRPSGIDNSVITYGGALKFKSGVITPLKEMPCLPILVVNTKAERSTKTLVANVATRLDLYPSVTKSILEAMDALAEQSLETIQLLADDYSPILFSKEETLVDINHHLLCSLGVSHPSLDRIVTVTLKYGLHSKLTGAGGGGCAFCLLHHDTTPHITSMLTEELRSEGYDSWLTRVGARGVCQHFVTDQSQLHSLIHHTAVPAT